MTSSCHLPRMGLIHILVPEDSRNDSTRVQSPLTITFSPALLNVPGSTHIYPASHDLGAGVTCSNTAIAVGKVRFLHKALLLWCLIMMSTYAQHFTYRIFEGLLLIDCSWFPCVASYISHLLTSHFKIEGMLCEITPKPYNSGHWTEEPLSICRCCHDSFWG